MFPDHYSILGIAPEASQEEIRSSYRRLAKEHHPDAGGDASRFRAIQAAYEVLSDPDRRREYDALLKAASPPKASNALPIRLIMRDFSSNRPARCRPEPLIPPRGIPRSARQAWHFTSPLDTYERLIREVDRLFESLEAEFSNFG